MNRQTLIFERLKKIIVEQLVVDPNDVTPQANFFNDLNADELDGKELVMAVEAEFDIEIRDEAVEQIATVQQAMDYLVNNYSPALEKWLKEIQVQEEKRLKEIQAQEEKRLKEIQARIEPIVDYWAKLEDICEEEAIDLTKKAFNVIRERHIASKRKELDKLRTKLKTAEVEMESIKAKIEQCEKDLE